MTGVTQPGERLRADGVLLAVTAIWGLTFVVVKDALALADPFTWLALRFLVGATALTFIARWVGGTVSWRAGVGLGVMLWSSFALQTLGLQYSTPSRSAFITGLFVVLTPFTSLAILRRPPRPASLLGVSLAFAGTYWLTGIEPGSMGPPSSATLLGDLLTLGCALAYALHLSLTERYAAGSAPASLVAVQLWVTCGLSALAIPFGAPRLQPSASLAGALLFTGLLASALAFTAQTWAQARTTAVRAALVIATEPLFAAAYSVASGRESLGRRELAGGALIIAGVLVSEVGRLWQAGPAGRDP